MTSSKKVRLRSDHKRRRLSERTQQAPLFFLTIFGLAELNGEPPMRGIIKGTQLRQLCFPLLVFIFVTAYLVDAVSLGRPIKHGAPSASFMPILLSIIMYIATTVVVFGIFSTKTSGDEKQLSNFSAPILVVAITAIYIGIFVQFGFEISTALYVYALLTLFGYPANRSIGGVVKRVLLSLLITLVIYAFFAFGFGVQLPTFEGWA